MLEDKYELYMGFLSYTSDHPQMPNEVLKLNCSLMTMTIGTIKGQI